MTNRNNTLSLRQAYQDFTKLILALSDEQFLAGMNGWAPRDVVGHLIGWNGLMVESAKSILAGKTPAYYADAPNDYSNINAAFTAKFASRSKQELLADLQSSIEKLEAFVDSLPAKELAADHGVHHYSGSPASVIKIIHSLAGDYQYHSQQISEWMNGK